MTPAITDCFPSRIRCADNHLALGEWASCHAIASGLLQCAARGGCTDKNNCACAANSVLRSLRDLLGH